MARPDFALVTLDFGNRLADPGEQIAKDRVERTRPALVKPYESWLSEDYFIFFLREIAGNPSASQLLSSCSQQISQVVRGENMVLSDDERREVIQSAMSYYPNDLAVLGERGFRVRFRGWFRNHHATAQYANSQLLEFRHYDDLLTRELAAVYDSLERNSNFIGRWRLPREASHCRPSCSITELTERADNAIKFSATCLGTALPPGGEKVGVPDYKSLAKEKLRTAEDLYRFLIDEFHQSRTFWLESMVVLILLIELVYVFHGKM